MKRKDMSKIICKHLRKDSLVDGVSETYLIASIMDALKEIEEKEEEGLHFTVKGEDEIILYTTNSLTKAKQWAKKNKEALFIYGTNKSTNTSSHDIVYEENVRVDLNSEGIYWTVEDSCGTVFQEFGSLKEAEKWYAKMADEDMTHICGFIQELDEEGDVVDEDIVYMKKMC